MRVNTRKAERAHAQPGEVKLRGLRPLTHEPFRTRTTYIRPSSTDCSKKDTIARINMGDGSRSRSAVISVQLSSLLEALGVLRRQAEREES
jgi:hypothetical protein